VIVENKKQVVKKMVKSFKSSFVVASSGIVLGALALYFYNFNTTNSGTTGTSIPMIAAKTSAVSKVTIPKLSHVSLPKPEPIARADEEFEALKLDLIEKMRQQYRGMIENIAVQVSLKEFLDDLMKTYPVKGKELFEAIIRGAFPEIAENILRAVDTMVLYEDWLLENVLTLNDMPPLEYNGELWKKRRELFGEDANKIWSSEITAQEERREVLQKTVAMLDQSHDTTMYERIYILQTSYEEQYSETIENVVFDSKGVLAQTLFGFDAVQNELSAMSNEQRQTEIDTIRRTIGFDEAQIEYLAEQDQVKDKRWLNGFSYMEAREVLLEGLSGEELDTALTELREKHFKHEAPTIAREERDEFFRYTRPRIYGRN